MGEMLAMVRRLIGQPVAPPGRSMRIVMAIQGITDAEARTMLWSPITAA